MSRVAYREHDASRPPAQHATERWAPPPWRRLPNRSGHLVWVLNGRQSGLRFGPARTWDMLCVIVLEELHKYGIYTQPQVPMHSHTFHQGKTRQRNHTSPLFSAMVARSQSSAAGVLALLYEPESVFKQHALKALNPLVPQFWAEISEHIALMSVQISFLAF